MSNSPLQYSCSASALEGRKGCVPWYARLTVTYDRPVSFDTWDMVSFFARMYRASVVLEGFAVKLIAAVYHKVYCIGNTAAYMVCSMDDIVGYRSRYHSRLGSAGCQHR